MKSIIVVFIFLFAFAVRSQDSIPTINEINIDNLPPNQIKKFWLKLTDNGISQPVLVPLIIAKGKTTSPVLGLTAALHGNELNGIPIIRNIMEDLDIKNLNGTIIAVPGLNSIGIPHHKRRFLDEADLNRNFPGKRDGNRSQQYVWNINQKILSRFDFLIDMHTASFGRVNTLYVRADMDDEQMKQMALLQDADIILNSKGSPSTNTSNSGLRTMRSEAMLKGIPAITVEYGNPQVYQNDLIRRGSRGIKNVMAWLKMTDDQITDHPKATLCKNSFWMYTDKGGYLEVYAELNQKVKSKDLIAVLRNPFGDVLEYYYAPDDGIVIGKSSNPVNMAGGRILHLGLIQE